MASDQLESDPRRELDDNFVALFGNAYRGVDLRMEREVDTIYSMLGINAGAQVRSESYTLIVHVIYDMDRVLANERLRGGQFNYIHPLKPFNIGSHRPTSIESRPEPAYSHGGSRLIVRAEYTTHDLSRFIADLKEAARKVQDERFYEELDKVLDDPDKKG